MKILLLDANNLIYRARYAAKFAREGDATIVYSFFRSLKPLMEKFNPDKCYFVRDGAPQDRVDLYSGYKANRERNLDEKFLSQKRNIENIVLELLPIVYCRNMQVEADDLIAFLVNETHKEDECVVVSSDTDFIQLLQSHPNCKLYNPITKKFRECPEYDYLTWKSLRGDASDNIPGIPRVGDKTAEKLALNENKLEEFLKSESNLQIYNRNKELISFRELDANQTFISDAVANFEQLKQIFTNYNFNSMVADKYWQKYVGCFEGVLNENIAK